MIKNFFILSVIFFFISCEKESEFTKNISNDSISNTATLLYSGSFAPTSGISVTGSAKIYNDNGQKKVLLDNFSISDGPDLKVYLSTTNSPTTFVNLGSLTSSRVYLIPSAVDLTVYKYVLIHCQQYNHLFAIAELM
ncbi:DM13 domain-containing protein [Flavobacterium sp.]|uniref:DM13 domain-containing protein n=1 Tax=Flavobacterium sp. TaxID=239 RepID=UPI00374DD658